MKKLFEISPYMFDSKGGKVLILFPFLKKTWGIGLKSFKLKKFEKWD